MKIRKGFVSNSSSSSFIVWEGTTLDSFNGLKIEDNVLIVDGSIGEFEFGWEHAIYDSVYSKIHFAYFQTQIGKNKFWLEMLERVIKEETGVTEILWGITSEHQEKGDRKWGYIDHQSSACENRNVEIFTTIDDLKIFLFCSSVYIQGGNDNDYGFDYDYSF